MNFYKQTKHYTNIVCNDIYEAESIEEQLRRVTTSNEPIDTSAPIMYTPRKDGVLPQTDIRTDRFDIAIDAMDKVSASFMARRDEAIKTETNKDLTFVTE